MAQDKEEKKTEDETYKAEAAHRLELAKADEKRIREEIEALKKETGKNHQFRQPRRTARLNRFQSETKGLCR